MRLEEELRNTVYVYSRGGDLKGEIHGWRPCQLESCHGARANVLWPDGQRTWPCTDGMFTREDGDLQIGEPTK